MSIQMTIVAVFYVGMGILYLIITLIGKYQEGIGTCLPIWWMFYKGMPELRKIPKLVISILLALVCLPFDIAGVALSLLFYILSNFWFALKWLCLVDRPEVERQWTKYHTLHHFGWRA